MHPALKPTSARPPGSDTARVACGVGAAALVLLVLVDALVRDEPAPRGDELIYELMARDPGGTHTFPFAYRIAVPWLVQVLPFGHTFSFSAIAWLCSAGAAASLFALLERFGHARRISVPLAISLAICPVLLVASLRQGRSADPLTLLIMCAGALCIVERAPRALAAVVLIGALNRESALFLVPWAYVAWAARPVDPGALRTVALAAVPGVGAYAALRLAIPTVGREQVVGYGGSLLGDRIDVIDANLEQPFATARRLALAFGPLWLLAPLALRRDDWSRRALVLPALCAVAMTFALDWGRIAVIAAPAVYAASAFALRERPRWAIPALVAWYATIAAYAVYMQVHGVEAGIIDAGDPAYPVR